MTSDASPRDEHSPHQGGPRGPRPARVEVTGTGTASATPDVVRVSLGIRADADGVAGALSSANETVRAVTTAAREHGLADRDLASTSASVQPRWDRDGTRVVGYTAYHQLSLTVRRLESLNGLVDAVAAAAGNRLVIDGITLDLADRAPLQVAAREVAFADAQVKAQQYAALSGARLGRVLALVESGGGWSPPTPAYGGRMMAMAADSAGGMPVEAGEHAVSASVTVAWALDPTE